MTTTNRTLRALAIVWTALQLLAGPGLDATRARDAPVHVEVMFSIDEDVSPEDEMLIREGIRFGQDFLEHEIGVSVGNPLIVNARAISPEDAPVIGMSAGHWIGIYTGSEGWISSPPRERLRVVLHEFVHVWQAELLGDGEQFSPMWINEGLSEYLSYRALARLDLLELADADAYNALALSIGPSLPQLSELESVQEFQAQDPAVYALVYFALRDLFGGLDLATIRDYFRILEINADWESAFTSAFGLKPSDFYGDFQADRSEVEAPRVIPGSFLPVWPEEIDATIDSAATVDEVAHGGQAVILAETEPSARCSLQVKSPVGRTIADLPTFADALGDAFWLWTAPEEIVRGTATLTLECGDEPLTLKLRIA